MLSTSRYEWNAPATRYRDKRTRRFVSRAEVRAEIDRQLAKAQARMAEISQQLREGTISLATWTAEMRAVLKEIHLVSAAAAKGGWAQVSQADYGRVGSLIREQYHFLENFAGQIVDGQVLDGRFLRRVALYAQGGRRTYHRIERGVMDASDFAEERSILHPADHCGECVAEAKRGWQAIGSIIPIGERTCLGGCRCTMSYR